LGKASIPISPIDVTETAQALYKALTMPTDERRNKATLARQLVERQDLNGWLRRQIGDINDLLDRLPTRMASFEPAFRVPAESVV
jgi:trehalose-6-phosphate synthase